MYEILLHEKFKHEKVNGVYMLYTSLKKQGWYVYPDHVKVQGKKHVVTFQREKSASACMIYKPTDESKLDIPGCRNYGMIIFLRDEDMP